AAIPPLISVDPHVRGPRGSAANFHNRRRWDGGDIDPAARRGARRGGGQCHAEHCGGEKLSESSIGHLTTPFALTPARSVRCRVVSRAHNNAFPDHSDR